MSDSSSDQAIAEEILDLQIAWVLGNYTALSAFVLWFQDFLFTFPTEVQSIWSRRLTGSSMVFILSRYSFLLYAVMQPIIFLPGTLSGTGCRDLDFTVRLFFNVAGAATKLLSILRVYALFGQKRSLLILLCPFVIADLVAGFLSWFSGTVTTSQGTYAQPFSPCFDSGQGLELEIWTSVSPLLQLTFDSIIFILTFIRTSHQVIQARKSGVYTIAKVILRDGTLYFFAIFIIASIQATITLGSLWSNGTISNTVAQATVVASSFLNVLPNLLINRFVLDLRAFSRRTVQHSGKRPSSTTLVTALSAPNFAENRLIGNMGAPLDPDQWDEAHEFESVSEIKHKYDWDGDRVVDPLTTLVPVIYDFEMGSTISLVPMQRQRAHGGN